MRVAIIGAGPGGLSAAYQLTGQKIKVDIYESRDHVGGLASSIYLWGKPVELGPHFLLRDTDEEVQQLLKKILRNEEVHHYRRLTRICTTDKYIQYPPTPFTIARNIGIKNCLITLAALCNPWLSVSAKQGSGSFEQQIKRKVGSAIYEKFFRGYTEKLWGIPGSQINEEYATSLIGVGGLTLAALLKKVLQLEKRKNQSDCIYPVGGMSRLWDALHKKIAAQGGVFHLSANITRVIPDNGITLELSGNVRKHYDYVISTAPEAKLLQLFDDPAAGRLYHECKKITYRQAILIFLQISGDALITDNNLYIHHPAMKCVRATNYNRFSNRPGNDIIMLEYWVDSNDAMWTAADEALLATARQDIAHLALHKRVQILQAEVVRLKNAFPVPDLRIKKIKNAVAEYLNPFEQLIRIGRSNQANFNYGMEDALKEGITCTRELIAKAHTDAETHGAARSPFHQF